MWLYAYTVVVLAILAHVINKEKKLCEKKKRIKPKKKLFEFS